MRRVVGYVRVSSEGQATEGVSLDAQRTKLAAYCLAMDLELVALEADEGVSAKTLRRPGLQRALAALEEGRADAVLVTKLDRLTRSVRDLGDLVERYFGGERWSLLSVGDSIDTKTAAGRLVLNVLVSVAQWEREATGERTRDALAEVKRQGGTLGADALGWRRVEETRRRGSSVRRARRCRSRDAGAHRGPSRRGSLAARHRDDADRGRPRDEARGPLGRGASAGRAGARGVIGSELLVLEMALRALGAFRANDNDGDHDHEDEDHHEDEGRSATRGLTKRRRARGEGRGVAPPR
jgi:site-specific DNA recombinase